MTEQTDGAVVKGEWSDASEDVVKSGSATDASKGDMDDTSVKKPAKQDRESSFLQSSLSGKKDPLNSILDKIDAELAALPARESAGIMKTSPNSKHSRSPSPFRNLSRKGGQDSEAVELQNGVSESFREEEAWGSDQQDQKIAGSAEIYTDATLTDAPTDDDGAAGWVPDHDNPSDLDSVVAQQIDNRFKEILMKKKVSLDPSTFLQKPPSPPHDQRDTTSLYRVAGGYGTDNESIRTEDFESRFHSLLVMSDGSMAAETFTRKRQVQSNSNRGGASRGQGNEKKLGKMMRLTPVPKPLTSQKASSRPAGEPMDTKPSGLGLPSTIRSVLTHSMKSLGESVSPAPTASDLAGEVTDPSHVRSSNFTSDRLLSLVRHQSGGNLIQAGHAGYLNGPGSHPVWEDDLWRNNQFYKPQQFSAGSSASTFEEVESLCLSKSSSDSSFGQFRRHGLVGSGVVGQVPPTHGSRFLSRQSSTTSTSTSSGNPGDQLDRRSHSTSTSGSVHGDGMDGADQRQQFDFNEHAFYERMFRHVLDWNNSHAGTGGSAGRSAGGISGSGVGNEKGMVLNSESSPHKGVGSPLAPGVHRNQAVGRRSHDINDLKKQVSPTSDITHLKRRRDLIIPDEEEEFSFPHNRSSIPDYNSRVTGKQSNSSFKSVSSKQRSSDSMSMMSSMSSVSASQDQSWRDLQYSGMPSAGWINQQSQNWASDYHNQVPWREHPSQGRWVDPHMVQPSTSSSAAYPANFMPSLPFGRGMSFDNVNGIGMPGGPESFRYNAPSPSLMPGHMQNPAEVMLMNLGFGTSEGFLPERFLRDWINKMSRAQLQTQLSATSQNQSDIRESPYGSTPNTHSGEIARATTIQSPKTSLDDVASASDLHQRFGHLITRPSTMASKVSYDMADLPSALPPNVVSDSRIDRLKEYIDAYDENMSNSSDTHNMRIRQFAHSRQKSLPLYLETLNEEDEAKSRKSTYNPHDQESRLQKFLREDSFSTSGRSESQCTSSGCASNEQSLCGSESDSLSGSDHHSYVMRQNARKQAPPTLNSSQLTPGVRYTQTLKLPRVVLSEMRPGTQESGPREAAAELAQNSGRGGSNHSETKCIIGGSEVIKEKGQDKSHSSSSNDVDTGTGTTDSSSSSKGHNRHHHHHQNHHHHHKHHHHNSSHSSSDANKDLGENRLRSPNGTQEHGSKSPNARERFKLKSPKSHHCSKSPKRTKGDKNHNSPSLHRSKSLRSKQEILCRSATVINNVNSPEKTQSLGTKYANLARQEVGKKPFTPYTGSDTKDEVHYDDTIKQTQTHSKVSEKSTLHMQSDLEQMNGCAYTSHPNSMTDKHKVDSLCSTESLEVADIFQNMGARSKSSSNTGKAVLKGRGFGQVEPAMVSIVLEDVDGNLMESSGSGDDLIPPHVQQLLHQDQQHPDEGLPHDVLLHIPPSRSSSISVSPIPLSPVTVIEVSLDNQQDSIDMEEGAGSSRDDVDEITGEYYRRRRSSAEAIGYDTDPAEFPVNVEVNLEQRLTSALPFSDTQSESGCMNSASLPKKAHDVCVEADDGKQSPIILFSTNSPFTSSSSSSSFQPIVPTKVKESGIQTDSTCLSPLERLVTDSHRSILTVNEPLEDFYVVVDEAIQCESSEEHGECTKEFNLLYETSNADDILMEIAERCTQTNRQIIYEISSQTELKAGVVPQVSCGIQTEAESADLACHLSSPDWEFWEHLDAHLPFGTDQNAFRSNFTERNGWAMPEFTNTSALYSPSLSPSSLEMPFIALPTSCKFQAKTDSRYLQASPSNIQSFQFHHLDKSIQHSENGVQSPKGYLSQLQCKVEHKCVNTCISIAVDEHSDPPAVLRAHCVYTKPFVIAVDGLVLQKSQGDERVPQSLVHVSSITCTIADYRQGTVKGAFGASDQIFQENLGKTVQSASMDEVSLKVTDSVKRNLDFLMVNEGCGKKAVIDSHDLSQEFGTNISRLGKESSVDPQSQENKLEAKKGEGSSRHNRLVSILRRSFECGPSSAEQDSIVEEPVSRMFTESAEESRKRFITQILLINPIAKHDEKLSQDQAHMFLAQTLHASNDSAASDGELKESILNMCNASAENSDQEDYCSNSALAKISVADSSSWVVSPSETITERETAHLTDHAFEESKGAVHIGEILPLVQNASQNEEKVTGDISEIKRTELCGNTLPIKQPELIGDTSHSKETLQVDDISQNKASVITVDTLQIQGKCVTTGISQNEESIDDAFEAKLKVWNTFLLCAPAHLQTPYPVRVKTDKQCAPAHLQIPYPVRDKTDEQCAPDSLVFENQAKDSLSIQPISHSTDNLHSSETTCTDKSNLSRDEAQSHASASKEIAPVSKGENTQTRNSQMFEEFAESIIKDVCPRYEDSPFKPEIKAAIPNTIEVVDREDASAKEEVQDTEDNFSDTSSELSVICTCSYKVTPNSDSGVDKLETVKLKSSQSSTILEDRCLTSRLFSDFHGQGRLHDWGSSPVDRSCFIDGEGVKSFDHYSSTDLDVCESQASRTEQDETLQLPFSMHNLKEVMNVEPDIGQMYEFEMLRDVCPRQETKESTERNHTCTCDENKVKGVEANDTTEATFFHDHIALAHCTVLTAVSDDPKEKDSEVTCTDGIAETSAKSVSKLSSTSLECKASAETFDVKMPTVLESNILKESNSEVKRAKLSPYVPEIETQMNSPSHLDKLSSFDVLYEQAAALLKEDGEDFLLDSLNTASQPYPRVEHDHNKTLLQSDLRHTPSSSASADMMSDYLSEQQVQSEDVDDLVELEVVNMTPQLINLYEEDSPLKKSFLSVEARDLKSPVLFTRCCNDKRVCVGNTSSNGSSPGMQNNIYEQIDDLEEKHSLQPSLESGNHGQTHILNGSLASMNVYSTDMSFSQDTVSFKNNSTSKTLFGVSEMCHGSNKLAVDHDNQPAAKYSLTDHRFFQRTKSHRDDTETQNIDELQTVLESTTIAHQMAFTHSTTDSDSSSFPHNISRTPEDNSSSRVQSLLSTFFNPPLVQSPGRGTDTSQSWINNRKHFLPGLSPIFSLSPERESPNLETYLSPERQSPNLETYLSPERQSPNLETYLSPERQSPNLETYLSPERQSPNLETYLSPEEIGSFGESDMQEPLNTSPILNDNTQSLSSPLPSEIGDLRDQPPTPLVEMLSGKNSSLSQIHLAKSPLSKGRVSSLPVLTNNCHPISKISTNSAQQSINFFPTDSLPCEPVMSKNDNSVKSSSPEFNRSAASDSKYGGSKWSPNRGVSPDRNRPERFSPEAASLKVSHSSPKVAGNALNNTVESETGSAQKYAQERVPLSNTSKKGDLQSKNDVIDDSVPNGSLGSVRRTDLDNLKKNGHLSDQSEFMSQSWNSSLNRNRELGKVRDGVAKLSSLVSKPHTLSSAVSSGIRKGANFKTVRELAKQFENM